MTLADTSHAIHKCCNALANHYGLPEVSHELALSSMGMTIEDSWRLYWGDYKEEWVDYYRSQLRGKEQSGTQLFPNAVSALERLRSSGTITGVVSNRRFAARVVGNMGLTPYMDVIVGLEDVDRAKPDPQALIKAMEKLGVGAEETLYVGDTDIDMLAAKNASVRGVGMTTGNFGRNALLAAGAWRVCDDLGELPEITKG